MSGTIWLITEDENDYKIVRAIITKLTLPIRIVWRSPSGKTPGLSRLASELKQLITDAKARLSGNDCIVVLHDADEHRQPNRTNYDKIREICKSEKVTLIVAQDEIEAWLLSDSGICRWLGESIKTWNGEAHPSDYLRSRLQAKYKLKYPRDLPKLLRYLNADSSNISFNDALKRLENAPCLKPE